MSSQCGHRMCPWRYINLTDVYTSGTDTHMFRHKLTMFFFFIFHGSFLRALTASALLSHKEWDSAVISQSGWIHADAPVCTVCFLKTPLFLFLILWGEAEREKEGETSIECWQGHNLPSLHTLFTVSPLCRYTLLSQWSHKKQMGAFREIACALKINNSCTSSPKKVSRSKNDIGRLKVPHP